MTSCSDCVNAYRVLDASGQTRSGFRWNDGTDQRTQQQALEADGVVFTGNRADAAHRLPEAALRGLAGALSSDIS